MNENLFNTEVTIPESTYHPMKILKATIPAGKTLKIETSPDGEELGEGLVPAGQEADVEIYIVVNFRDV